MPSTGYLQNHFKSVQDLVMKVGLEVNLGVPGGNDPLASTDPLWKQLVQQSIEVGRSFMRQRDWQMFQRQHVFTTTTQTPPAAGQPGNVAFYSLPDDFLRIIDQTQWNFSSQLPMGGPISPQITTWLVGRMSTSFGIVLGFRLEQGDFGVFQSPNASGQVIFFEYMSKNWCQKTGTNGQADRYDPDVGVVGYNAGADLILFDPHLFSRALKVRWLADKGFDTAAAQSDFDAAWSAVAGSDEGAPTLNMNNNPSGFRFLDPLYNIPPSGFGSP